MRTLFDVTLWRVVQVFRDTGSVGRKEGTGLTTKPESTENVRQIMNDAPRTSTSRIVTVDWNEAWFYLNGYVNSQNMRMWSVAKLDNFYVEQPLHPQKIGV
ncbi:hypothetical protein BDFB_012569, partial [Asbolus verrucosus]